MENRFAILVLDDDREVLKAVETIFRHQSEEIECFTTVDHHEAEAILREKPIDLVLCDEHMPEVKGHAFLSFTKTHYPLAVRIILTAHPDLDLLMAAINRGEVYRFIQKPWDDEEFEVTIRRALEHGRLQRKQLELEVELKKKNRELEQMNSRLESLVQRRNAELQKTLEMLQKSRDRAVGGFNGSANLLNSMIHLFQREIGNHARRVAGISERVGSLLGFDEEQLRTLVIAAYFHEIGRVSRQDGNSDPETREKYAEIGENLISQGMGMKDIGKIIRHHREHYDGTGKPDGLSGEAIPMESRILKALAEYDWMINRDKKSTSDSLAFLLQHCGTLYDPAVVQAFHRILRESGEIGSRGVTLAELKPGMELLNDIFLRDGVLFLPGKTVITVEMLERIKSFSTLIREDKIYYVRPEGRMHG
jgi:response regulator RpfG family c-di-GMP phosphodiesterase